VSLMGQESEFSLTEETGSGCRAGTMYRAPTWQRRLLPGFRAFHASYLLIWCKPSKLISRIIQG
jgi:hypothetical protein